MAAPGRPARLAATVALVLGLGHAAVSLSWVCGSTWLLDTVGGDLAARGAARDPWVIGAAGAAVALKLLAAVLPWLVVHRIGAPVVRWWVRAAAWVAAVVLTGYGAVLTAAGLAVQTGLLEASADADHHALAWHAVVWDPWFLAWGVATTVALLASVRPSGAGNPAGGGVPAPGQPRSRGSRRTSAPTPDPARTLGTPARRGGT